MAGKIAVLILALSLLSGCVLVTAFPGGYMAVDIPPITVQPHVQVQTQASVDWSLIPSTTIYYSQSYPDILYYGGYYYYTVNGAWYLGRSYLGPWRTLSNVPDVFFYIPSNHPAFHVVRSHPHYRSYYGSPRAPYVEPRHPSPIPPSSAHSPTHGPEREPAPAPTPSGGVVPRKGKPGEKEDETPPPTPSPIPPPEWHRR